MKLKYFYLALVILFSLSDIYGQKLISKSKWKSDVKIDGKNAEWEKPLNFFNDKTGMMYTISNDSSNLYFCVSVYNKQNFRKIVNAGWSILISSKEKNNKFKAIIDFPPIGSNFKEQNINTKAKIDNNTEFDNIVEGISISYKLQFENITASGFDMNEEKVPFINLKNNKIDVGVDEQKNMFYEIQIPFENIFFKKSVAYNEELEINVNLNAMKNIETFQNGQKNKGSGKGNGNGNGNG
ncbi:MAG: hypothetical protein JXR51_08955, partial [Bacteroidales bacterium]|nr:hypothetical protein [Bacteroidales bacterium]